MSCAVAVWHRSILHFPGLWAWAGLSKHPPPLSSAAAFCALPEEAGGSCLGEGTAQRAHRQWCLWRAELLVQEDLQEEKSLKMFLNLKLLDLFKKYRKF